MAVLRPCFFDTSVLIAGIVRLRGGEDAAQALMQAVSEGDLGRPRTAWHCCLEFYSVLTRLPVEYRVPPKIALMLLREEILARFDVLQLAPSDYEAFMVAALDERVAGGRVYDAHIAEIARASGASTVVTGNRRHFTSLLRHGIRVLTASELARDLSVS